MYPYCAPVFLSLASSGATVPEGSQSLGVILVVLFVTAAIVATIFRRFKMEAIPGYLLAGALVGPHALKLISDGASVEQVSDLALVLLMFTLGLHLDVNSMRKGLVHIVAVGVGSTLVSALLIWGLLLLLGVPRPNALILALGMSMCSTAVLVRVIMSRRETSALHGRVSLGISIVQDLLSVIMLGLIPVIVAWGSGGQGTDAASSSHGGMTFSNDFPNWLNGTLKGILASSGVFLMLVVGQKILPWILDRVSKLKSDELVLVTAAAIALLCAAWTTFIGFGNAMGAFLAGFMLGLTPYRYQLSGQLSPMRDLLMAVFFTSVGLKVAPMEVVENIVPIIVTLIGVLTLKTLSVGLSCYLAGMTARSSLLTGAYVGNAGEFTLVIVAAGAALLTPSETGLAIAVVILSLVATPFLLPSARTLAAKLVNVPLSPWIRNTVLKDTDAQAQGSASQDSHTASHSSSSSAEGDALTDASAIPEEFATTRMYVGEYTPVLRPKHVIIAGFGPVGRALADRLDVQKVPFTVVELNANTIQRQGTLGRRVVYGDITNKEVLEQAGLHHSDAIFLTIPDDDATLRATQVIREAHPNIFIAVRTSFLSGKFTAMTLGADIVTVEEVATAVAMEREVLDGLAHHLHKRGK